MGRVWSLQDGDRVRRRLQAGRPQKWHHHHPGWAAEPLSRGSDGSGEARAPREERMRGWVGVRGGASGPRGSGGAGLCWVWVLGGPGQLGLGSGGGAQGAGSRGTGASAQGAGAQGTGAGAQGIGAGAQGTGVRCSGHRCSGHRCRCSGPRCSGHRFSGHRCRCSGHRCMCSGRRCMGSGGRESGRRAPLEAAEAQSKGKACDRETPATPWGRA